MAVSSVICGLIFPAALADAAISDIRALRIANRVPVVLILSGALALLMSTDPVAWISHGAAGLLVLLLGAVLFSLRLWGAGDAKMLAAVALWTGFEGLGRLLLVMTLAGGALALLTLAMRRVPLGAGGGRLVAGGHLPYGVAIAVAGLDWWMAALLPRLL